MINYLYNMQPLNFNTWNSSNTYAQNPYTSSSTVNNNPQNMTISGSSLPFGLDLNTGVIAVLITAVAIGTVSGILVLGSGVNTVSTMIVFKSSLFFMIWALFSITGLAMLIAIPLFGWVIYLFLTLIYSIGVAQQIGFGSA
jgi:hypothetical protein